ncbi:MAG TPA: 2'-5' RNA ligase family protein [Gaiellaceae bacterium]
MRSAVIVPVPEASGAVDHWREQTGNDKPSIGVPPHITLLFPFVPAAQLTDEVIASLRDVVATVPAFELALRETARFPELLYLAPEPAAPFTQLTELIAARFPDYAPYEGAIALADLTPHLTVAYGDTELLADAEADVRPRLPITAVVREAVLLEEVEPNWGRWEVRAQLPLS